MKKLKILDFYCHQGHQYEFFKTGHDFYLCGLNSLKPEWNTKHRPLPSNVNLITEISAKHIKFDVVIVRSPLNPKRYDPFIKKRAIPVAVVQTTDPFPLSPKVHHIVWNSKVSMDRRIDYYNKRMNHHYIVHGYDPDEFRILDLERNDRVLSAINVFKRRSQFVGYKLWDEVNKDLGGICDVLGHGNPKLKESIGQADTLEELIMQYNLYGVYFNPTNNSAMPRSRAEAMMCGCPIVSTNNFDITMYMRHKKDGIITNDKNKLISGIRRVLRSKDLQEEYSNRAREIAVLNFNLKDYVDKWNHLFASL